LPITSQVSDPADVLRHQPVKWLALLAAYLDGGAGHRAPFGQGHDAAPVGATARTVFRASK
jgi:hypothetical protein